MCRKDVRLPQQLQRAMAAEAEASREARAKVLIDWEVNFSNLLITIKFENHKPNGWKEKKICRNFH